MDIHIAYISVGSNLGDKLGHCRRGVEALAVDGRVRILALSRLYRTEPVGYADQDWFINRVIKIGTDLDPLPLMERLQAVQQALGRTAPAVRFGPRVLDLDILLYDWLVFDDPRLSIPHPRMHAREAPRPAGHLFRAGRSTRPRRGCPRCGCRRRPEPALRAVGRGPAPTRRTGRHAQVNLTVTSNGAILIVNAGADQPEAVEGTEVIFAGSYTLPGGQSEAVSIHWDFGDGLTASGMLTPTHTYADNRSYTVTLIITDHLGGVGSDWLTITVSNAPPKLNTLPDQNVDVGQLITVSGVFTDTGWLDTHTAVIQWADGLTDTLVLAAGTNEFSFSHSYAAAGRYAVIVAVTPTPP